MVRMIWQMLRTRRIRIVTGIIRWRVRREAGVCNVGGCVVWPV
jgi:hypothetical protein